MVLPAVVAVSLFIAFMAYAVTRYVVFAGVPVSHVPLYVTNKAVSLLALVLLVVAVVGAPSGRWPSRRTTGLVAFALVVLHVVMSLAILTPAYFGKLYDDPAGASGFGALGELALLAGALAFVVLGAQAWLSPDGPLPPTRAAAMRAAGHAAVLLTVAHCVALGVRGWWPPSSWPGGLPPITLLAVLFAASGMAARTR